MPTQCSADLFGFAPVERRRVEAAFDGGAVTSDAGALLLGATDRAIDLVGRFARCFTDGRRSNAASTRRPATGDGCKTEQLCATLCRHRGPPPNRAKLLQHNNFDSFRAPMHLLAVRNPR